MKARTTTLIMTATLLALAGCGDAAGPAAEAGGDGPGGKADAVGNSGLRAALEGRDDVVSRWLREVGNDKGEVPGTYRELLTGVAEQMGCDLITQRTFVILLTRADYFPRNIMTLCSDDPLKASQFFISTQSDFGDLVDIDPRDIKMYAWDNKARTYRLYELKGIDGQQEGMKLSIEPGECRTCHTGPADMNNALMPFTPIMNELVNPWTLWNAEPDFRSHQFEDTINDAIAEAPVYKEMTEAGIMDSASNFEKHIRAAMDRVTNARMLKRRDPASVPESMALLRPMFCDETLNYVSENHFTGETHASVAIDDAIRRLFLTIRPDNWPWDWLNDGRLRLSIPGPGEEPLAVMPVRGESTVQVEVALVKRRVLSANQALRVRALDWQRPVMSQFRCGLFKDAEARLLTSPPDLSAFKRNIDLIPYLYNEIMTLHTTDPVSGQPRTIPLAPTTEGAALIAVADAQEAEAAYALSSGDFKDYEVSVDAFGDALEAHFQSLQEPGQRPLLDAERIARGCVARLLHPASPRIPGADDCR